MFRCGKTQRRKRKSSRWNAPQCLNGNKSIDASTLELTFDPHVVSPQKRRRIAPVGGSTFPLPMISESLDDYDITGSGFGYLEDDKENVSGPSHHDNGEAGSESKNNLFLWESTIIHQQSRSHQLSESSTFCHQSLATRDSENTCASRTQNDDDSVRPPFSEVQNVSVATLVPEHPSNILSEIDSDLTTDTTRLVSADSGSRSLKERSNTKESTTINPHSKGVLKLVITVRGSLISIHVQEASLDIDRVGDHRLFIETMLAPDREGQSAKQTQTQASINLRYEDTITYDIKASEHSKRLMVSMKDSQLDNKSCSKMVGCMSFGIKHLLTKGKKTEVPVDGWYHLLPENLGNRKHLIADKNDLVAKQQKHSEQNHHAETSSIQKASDEKIMKKLHGTQQYMVTVAKCSSGYGFTIKGSMPVRVGRVKPSGAAENAGLRNGDYILNINHKDITSSTVEAIANIVRNSTNQLQIQIARGQRSKDPKSPRCLPKSSFKSPGCLPTPTRSSHRDIQSSPEYNTVQTTAQDSPYTGGKEDERVPSNVDAAERISNWGVQLSQDILGDAEDHFQWQPELSVIREEKSMDLMSNRTKMSAATNSLWQPDLSVITPASTRYLPLQRRCHERTYEQIGTPLKSRSPSWHSLTPETGSSCQPDSFTDTETEYSAVPPNTSYSRYSKSYFTEAESTMYETKTMWKSTVEEESRFYRSFSSSDTAADETATTQMSAEEQLACTAGRQVAIHQLLTCEEDFTRMMKRGAQRFSRPLRHQLLSRSQHAALFQNIEKLVALSEFHIRQMINKSYCAEDSYVSTTNDVIADMVGQIYQTKVSMLCEAYQMYYHGLDTALQLLQDLKQNSTFHKCLEEREKLRGYELSLSEFLEQPLSHFQQLVGCLGRVLLTTPQQHADYAHIKHVMEVIHDSVTRPVEGERSVLSDKSSCYNISAESSSCSFRSRHRSMRRPSRDSGMSSSSSVSSVDAELRDLQQKLSFSRDVRPFQLAKSNRHVILSGDLMHVSDSSVNTRQVVLCSDLLLLTQKEATGQLKVTEEPIFLQQIVQADFDCVHADEFRILFQKSSPTSHPARSCEWAVGEYKFRATNMEQKWAWKTILGQRIQNVKSKTDSAYVSMEEFV